MVDIKDSKGRSIIKINDNGQVVAGRYIDTPEELKNQVIEIFSSLTNKDPQKLRDFLDFKDDEDSFCV